MALVGPTGVGKTTTVAKLAASFKLRHGRSVALITSDTYRIAAVDQLRTYASIIGLPLKVVMTPDEMRTAIDDLREAGHDLILIDTAGRSQNNTDRLAELAAFLDAARPDQTHLVLSSAASEAVLVRTAQAFASTRPNHILFTKLDEAVNFGVLVNVVQRVARELRLSQIDPRSAAQRGGGIPLSFVTTGQEVPDHIEPGRADRLARAVLDNRLTADERRPVDPPVHA
jgi:flagellar biosynthesis protein FlhF